MKEITMREFSRNVSKYLVRGELLVTRRGKDPLYVTVDDYARVRQNAKKVTIPDNNVRQTKEEKPVVRQKGVRHGDNVRQEDPQKIVAAEKTKKVEKPVSDYMKYSCGCIKQEGNYLCSKHGRV